MVFLQADAAAQTINEAAAQPVVATDAAATTTTTTEQPDDAPAQPTGVAAFLGNPLFMFVIIIAIMYFLMIRPQRKRQKEIENFRRSLQPGMEVVTSGGLYGKIKEINNGVVVIEIAHNVNVRVDISVVFANPGAIQEGAK
jgi:preprotein translocase subunit YajC